MPIVILTRVLYPLQIISSISNIIVIWLIPPPRNLILNQIFYLVSNTPSIKSTLNVIGIETFSLRLTFLSMFDMVVSLTSYVAAWTQVERTLHIQQAGTSASPAAPSGKTPPGIRETPALLHLMTESWEEDKWDCLGILLLGVQTLANF